MSVCYVNKGLQINLLRFYWVFGYDWIGLGLICYDWVFLSPFFVSIAFCSLIRIGVALVEILHFVHTDGISDIDIGLHCRIVAVPSPFHHYMRSYPHREGIAYECPSSRMRGKQFPFLRKPLVLPGTSVIYLRSILLIANP